MPDLPDGETYLGGGLYVSFDGWLLTLRAPRLDGDHFVFLDPDLYTSLRDYVRRYPRLAAHMGEAPL
jgi:hypothetical protein